jgi:sugar phosphate isomerase/epimerase
MHTFSRRSFLEELMSVTAGGVLAAALPNSRTLAATEPHIDFPAAPRDRIAVASYPFRAYINSPGNKDRDTSLPGMDLVEFASQVVTKFGVHNIEPYNRHFHSLDAADLNGLRESLAKLGVKIVNIPTSVERSFYDADASARAMAVAASKNWVDVAVAVGSPSIRLHIRSASNSAPDVQRAADSLGKAADYGARKNVVIHLENDDLVSEDAFFLVKVIQTAHHPYLRSLPDFANSALNGDPEFNYRALQALFPYAYGICHIKDGEADDHGKQYDIDLKRAFGILKASGYRGYCSMEYDAPGDPYGPTAKLIEQTIHYLS